MASVVLLLVQQTMGHGSFVQCGTALSLGGRESPCGKGVAAHVSMINKNPHREVISSRRFQLMSVVSGVL